MLSLTTNNTGLGHSSAIIELENPSYGEVMQIINLIETTLGKSWLFNTDEEEEEKNE